MGSCASGGNKDKEVDLYMEKYHKDRKHIVTDKSAYEISKQ